MIRPKAAAARECCALLCPSLPSVVANPIDDIQDALGAGMQLRSASQKITKMEHLARLILSLALLLASCSRPPFETAYWAWQRNETPSESDVAELSTQGVRTLYWHLGTLENAGGAWQWKARFSLPAPPGFEVVPVLRLESRERALFTPEATRSLLEIVAGAASGRGRLQIDYDCPDRLLLEYAAVLKQARKSVPGLSITALPGWIRKPALAQLGESVTELFPMLYDFAPDPVAAGAFPVPLIDPERSGAWLKEWTRCRTPWRAGLPNFARLTVFDPDGKSRGNVREWNWDAVAFNEALALERPTERGVTVFRARTGTRVGNTPIHENQRLVVRSPDRALLAELVAAARRSSAGGVVFFRLPDSSATSGWSLRQLQHLDARPRLILRKADDADRFELTNEGDGDLAPLFESTPPGYALQIEADVPIFREAEEGDFWRVQGEVERDAQVRAVMLPLATRLNFSFSQLRAGRSLQSGLIRLAPGADFSQVRFRILRTDQNEWTPLEK